MLSELDLHPVPIDGCATGLTDKHGTPLYKPWLIAVSSASLVEELTDFRCDKTHDHGKIAGDETAKTAYYVSSGVVRGHPPRSGCSWT